MAEKEQKEKLKFELETNPYTCAKALEQIADIIAIKPDLYENPYEKPKEIKNEYVDIVDYSQENGLKLHFQSGGYGKRRTSMDYSLGHRVGEKFYETSKELCLWNDGDIQKLCNFKIELQEKQVHI